MWEQFRQGQSGSGMTEATRTAAVLCCTGASGCCIVVYRAVASEYCDMLSGVVLWCAGLYLCCVTVPTHCTAVSVCCAMLVLSVVLCCVVICDCIAVSVCCALLSCVVL